MRTHSKLSYAVAAILGGGAAGPAVSATATDANSAVDQIQEITVTAQRRTENIQNVPIAIQALTSETLAQLNVTTFDDLIKYLPNVTAPTAGPGQAQIFMRGLSAGSNGTQSGGSITGFPNVAIYLDDQSGQLPGRNLDVYAADLERVEVLEGPQGTLFGAGAQAGVIRYITNKPKINVTEGSVTAGYGTTAGGDPNSDVTAVLNLPLIADTLAVRGVIYNDRRGGYINNVPAHVHAQGERSWHRLCATIRRAADPIPSPSQRHAVPGPARTARSSTTTALRPTRSTRSPIKGFASRLFGISIPIGMPFLPKATRASTPKACSTRCPMPRTVRRCPNSRSRCSTTPSTRTNSKIRPSRINGRFGDLKAVYTGAYLVRNVSQIQDYTNYARGVYADYYQCHGAEPANGLASKCYSPSTTWNETEHNSHQSHEFRLSTPDDWRFRGIVGAFWEELKIQDQLNWLYKTLPACTTTVTAGCLTDVAPAPGTSVINPNTRNDNTGILQ